MTKQEAEKIKSEVEDTLGCNWKGRVWNNLGWHVDWMNGAVVLSYAEYGEKRFWAMVGDIDSGTGNVELTPRQSKYFSNPISAVQEAIRYAQEADLRRRKIMQSCETVLMNLGKKKMSDEDKVDQIEINCPSCGAKQKMDVDAKSKICEVCKEIIHVEDIWAAPEDEYDDYFDYDYYDEPEEHEETWPDWIEDEEEFDY